MNSQNNLEQTIKKIHLMIAECPRVKGSPDKIVVDKNELFEHLEEVSQCLYDMLDEYKLTSEHKNEQLRMIKEEEKKMVESATQKVEDIYAASNLYTDHAVGQLIRVLEESQKSFDLLYAEFGKRMAEEKKRLRGNQKELENQLFEMRDSNLYMNVLSDFRRQTENAYEKSKKTMSKPKIENNYPEPEIKINQAYFEQMGLNPDGTKKEELREKETTEAPEIIVNTNSNYFKWKNGEEIINPFAKKKGDKDGTGK